LLLSQQRDTIDKKVEKTMFNIGNLRQASTIDKEIKKTRRYFSGTHNNHSRVPDRYWLLSLLLPDRPARILDIGPNIYVFKDLIDPRKRAQYEYHSMDLQLNYHEGWANEHIHNANHDAYPFENDYFDLIIATDVIEHLFDTDTFLRNIKRVLHPDGEVLLTTPNYGSPGCVLKILQGKMFHAPLSSGLDRYCYQEHMKYFTQRDLMPYLEKMGIHGKYIINQGYRTLLPFAENTFVQWLFTRYIYNNLIRLSGRFAPEIIIIGGKQVSQPSFLYL